MMNKYFLKSDPAHELGFRNRADVRKFLFEEVLVVYLTNFATLEDIDEFVNKRSRELEMYIAKHGDCSYLSLRASKARQRMYLLQMITESYELLHARDQGKGASHDN